MHLVGPDNTPLVVVNLNDQYPAMELQGIVPEVLKKIVTAYEMVSSFLWLSYTVCLKDFLNIYVIYCVMPGSKVVLTCDFLFHASLLVLESYSPECTAIGSVFLQSKT